MTNLDPLDLPPPQETPSPDSIVDLHGIIRMVLDKSWLIVSCVVLAVIAAAVYVNWAPRVYEALATVEVKQEETHVLTGPSVVDGEQRGLEVLNTVAQKLGNDHLLQQVLETNHLLPPEGIILPSGSKELTREQILTQFARNVKPSLRRNTRLIDLTVRNTNALLAAKLANSLIDNYLQMDAAGIYNTTHGATSFLEDEAGIHKKKLADAEKNLADYVRTNGSISVKDTENIATPRLKELSSSLTESTAKRILAEEAYTNSLTMSTNLEGMLAYPQVATDPEVVLISTEVAKYENAFVLVRLRYREKHPNYIATNESLINLKQQQIATALKVRSRIQETLRIAHENALSSENGLKAQMSEAESNVSQVSDKAVEYNLLSREVEVERAMFTQIIGRASDTGVAEKITPVRISVVQPALVPDLPASPKVKLIFALAVFGGLAVGLGISFVLESMNTSFRTVDSVEHFLNLPVLGTVPKLPKAESDANKLVAAEDRNSTGAEVFRTLRTTLSMLGRESERKTYLFTSSLPGEGKTFTSVNYAVSLAQQGLRTLLIDMDLRRPMVEEFFTEKRNKLPGVTDYFLGRKKFNELCLQHKDVPNLFWVPAGTSVPSPLELLTQSDFSQLLKEGLAQFDRIVVDTAPLLPVSDTLLLASKVQTVALVVHGGKTSRKAVERSVQLLKKAAAPIGGIVLNLLPSRRFTGGYYYSYYHGYGYGHYGYSHKDADKDKDKDKDKNKSSIDA